MISQKPRLGPRRTKQEVPCAIACGPFYTNLPGSSDFCIRVEPQRSLRCISHSWTIAGINESFSHSPLYSCTISSTTPYQRRKRIYFWAPTMVPSRTYRQGLLGLLCLTPALAFGQTGKADSIHSCLSRVGVQATVSVDETWANDTAAFQFRFP